MDYVKDTRIPDELEDQIWREAYGLAYVGASNPVATAGRLCNLTAEVQGLIGTREAEKHPALRAIAGHLAYLFGHGLGPESEYLDMVEENARRLGLIT